MKPNLCDYSDAYIVVTGDITAEGGNADTKVAFKNCVPFTRCVAHINDEHVETAENLDIIMPMYNLIEYSDNYADSSGSLYQFKRDEQNINNGNIYSKELIDCLFLLSITLIVMPTKSKETVTENISCLE